MSMDLYRIKLDLEKLCVRVNIIPVNRHTATRFSANNSTGIICIQDSGVEKTIKYFNECGIEGIKVVTETGREVLL